LIKKLASDRQQTCSLQTTLPFLTNAISKNTTPKKKLHKITTETTVMAQFHNHHGYDVAMVITASPWGSRPDDDYKVVADWLPQRRCYHGDIYQQMEL